MGTTVYAYKDASGILRRAATENFRFRGSWSATTVYSLNDVTNYSTGQYVLIVSSNTGTSPASASYWSQLVVVQPGPTTVYDIVYPEGSYTGVWWGTNFTFDLAGAPFQSCTVTSWGTVLVKNMAVPTDESILAIDCRLVSDGSAVHNLSWGSMAYFPNSAPPSALPANKAVVAKFTSYGEDIEEVYGIVQAQYV